MSAMDCETAAGRWIAEFGADAAWHASRRIGELREWGDDDGALEWTRVLRIILEKSRAV